MGNFGIRAGLSLATVTRAIASNASSSHLLIAVSSRPPVPGTSTEYSRALGGPISTTNARGDAESGRRAVAGPVAGAGDPYYADKVPIKVKFASSIDRRPYSQ